MYDFDGTGTLDSNGNLNVLSAFQAIETAIQNWIYMSLSERVMFPEEGNNVIYYLGKPMDDDMIAELTDKISSGIPEDFGENVKVSSCEVIPVHTERVIKITVSVTYNHIEISGITTLLTM